MSEVELSNDEKRRLLDGFEELRALSWEAGLLLRLLGHGKYEKAISKVLPSKDERVVYVLSNGDISYREVAKAAGVPKSKVERWWPEWIERGPGEAIPVQRGGQRCKAKYTLLELAVAVLEGQVDVDSL